MSSLSLLPPSFYLSIYISMYRSIWIILYICLSIYQSLSIYMCYCYVWLCCVVLYCVDCFVLRCRLRRLLWRLSVSTSLCPPTASPTSPCPSSTTATGRCSSTEGNNQPTHPPTTVASAGRAEEGMKEGRNQLLISQWASRTVRLLISLLISQSVSQSVDWLRCLEGSSSSSEAWKKRREEN